MGGRGGVYKLKGVLSRACASAFAARRSHNSLLLLQVGRVSDGEMNREGEAFGDGDGEEEEKEEEEKKEDEEDGDDEEEKDEEDRR